MGAVQQKPTTAEVHIVEEFSVISRAEARCAGLRYYFTGELCRRGHLAQRFVNSCRCADCLVENNTYHNARREPFCNRRPSAVDWLRLTDQQINDWYEKIALIRRGKKFVFGGQGVPCKTKPLEERSIVWAAPTYKMPM